MQFSSETLIVVAGLALIVIGLVGGGLKVKEITIPPIGKVARTAALLIGFVLMMIGLIEGDGEGDQSQPVNASDDSSYYQDEQDIDNDEADHFLDDEDYDAADSADYNNTDDGN